MSGRVASPAPPLTHAPRLAALAGVVPRGLWSPALASPATARPWPDISYLSGRLSVSPGLCSRLLPPIGPGAPPISPHAPPIGRMAHVGASIGLRGARMLG